MTRTLRLLLASASCAALAACAGGNTPANVAGPVDDMGQPVAALRAAVPKARARVGAIAMKAAATTNTNDLVSWCSYQATGNPACIQSAPDVAAAINARVAASNGLSTGQMVMTPTVSGGTADSLVRTGGSDSGTDIGAAVATAANSVATGTMPRTPAERAMSLPEPGDFLQSGQTIAALIGGNIDIGPIINTMVSRGLRGIHLPCGTYKLATTITLVNNLRITGDGACTIISGQIAAGDWFAGSSVQYTTIHDLTLQADVTMTAGSAIDYLNGFENRLYNILFTNGSGKHWTNITLSGANGTHIDRVAGRGGGGDGIDITGTSNRSEDTYINASGFDGYGGAPLHVTWSSGLYMSDLDLLGGMNAGVNIDPNDSLGQEVDGLRGTAVLADSNIGPGWRLGGTGAITEFNLTNCWGATNGYTPGTLTVSGLVAGLVLTNPQANNITVSSSEFHNNTGTGIDIENGTHVTITSNTVYMNSAGTNGGFPGINVGANPNFVVVASNQSGAGGEAQGSATQSNQSYGIASAQSTTDPGHYALFLGNLATGNQTGGFNIPTAAANPNVISSNNVGF